MTVALIGIAILVVILFLGFPLGLGLMVVGFFGFAFLHPNGLTAAFPLAGQQVLDLGLNFQFSVLPLFVLMGVFVTRAGLSDDLYKASNAWIGHFRGGLAMATVAACAGFSAVSGSSAATAATMAKVAVPSMRKYKYADSFSCGTVAAGGTMGFLIPPSGALIVYGMLTETDISKLFLAGVIPGALTVLVYILVIIVVTFIRPDIGPAGERSDWATRMKSLWRVWGVAVLFLLIMVGITFGVFTSTEAGGIGASGALIFAFLRRKMSWKVLVDSLIEAALTTATIFTVAFGALILNQFVNISGMPEAMVGFIQKLNVTTTQVVLIIIGFYLLLGMFIEGMAMVFLTVPIFCPVVFALGLDLIWFGILMVMVVEISLITPPLGLNVFILKAMVPEVPLTSIFKGIAPFFIADVFRVTVIVYFPVLVMFLPNLLR